MVLKHDARVRYAALAVALAVPAVAYAYSISSNPGLGDRAELATVSRVFGIAHTTGFPAFVILGFLASHLVPFGSVWYRVSLVSEAGVLAAIAALWFALADLETPPWIAAAATWIFAFGTIVWAHATNVEVHALALGFASWALALGIRYSLAGTARALFGACACAGFALATHPVSMWILPGLAFLALTGKRKPAPADALKAACCALAPLVLYAYIPLRSWWLDVHRVDPTLALSVPAGQPFWNYGDPSTPSRFWWLVSGQQYDTGAAFGTMLNPLHDLFAFGFVYDFARSNFGVLALIVAAGGFIALLRIHANVALSLLLTIALGGAFALGYRSIESDIARYLLVAIWIVALFAGIACASLAKLPYGKPAALIFAAALAIGDFWGNRGALAQHDDPGATTLIARVRHDTPPNAVVIGTWLFITPLGYAEYAEGSLDRRIVVASKIEDQPSLLRSLAVQRPTYVLFERPFAMRGFNALRADGRTDPYLYKVTAKN